MSKQGKLSVKAMIALVFIFAGLVSVIAYGTSNPSVFGHSASEIDFTGMSGNVVTSGDVQASRICIGTDCRTSWPTSTSTVSTGSPSIVFQAQRFTDDDTNYYIDINTGAHIGGNWALDGDLNVNGKVEADRLCIGSDCISSWPSTSSSSSATVIQTTVGTLESGCHPSEDNTAQFMNTCGHRFCTARGYKTGFVVEYMSDAASALADVSCFS
ncbi:MAG TPA: hypothetical protein VHA12_03650 [Candidatus Nanoarchaeia archaeon]|nr:hypothetical protein [Candidatus Nanoarchaeia archaeon]